jgi:hypothetical protein
MFNSNIKRQGKILQGNLILHIFLEPDDRLEGGKSLGGEVVSVGSLGERSLVEPDDRLEGDKRRTGEVVSVGRLGDWSQGKKQL